ncbi:MAG: hypothetical protein HKN25_01325, partial [Pyrinomonadaceae bacterium]|nr:hypothetical protein [Pyrinomonadaceae bacterium]
DPTPEPTPYPTPIPTPEPTPDSTPDLIPAEEPGAVPSAFLFYSLDKKEPEPATSAESDIDDWINTKTGNIFVNQVSNDLFEHKGGGPNGSEWNPEGDLYLSIFAPARQESGRPEIKINGIAIETARVIEKSSITRDGVVYWIRIPSDIWTKQLRRIDEKDLISLFDKETVLKALSGEQRSAAPLTTGRFIEMEITVGNQTLKKYFHATFGE